MAYTNRGTASGATCPVSAAQSFLRPVLFARKKRPFASRHRGNAATAAADSYAQQEQLIEWLATAGGDTLSGKIALRPSRQGLVATSQLSKGEAVLSVPQNLWITKEAAGAEGLTHLLEHFEPWLAIAIGLMVGKARVARSGKCTTAIERFAESLPLDHGSPVAWSSEELEMLKGTQLFTSVQAYNTFYEAKYTQLKAELFDLHPEIFTPPSAFTFDAFVWAASTVRSRAHSPLDGPDFALVPVADMVSHARGSSCNVQWTIKQKGVMGFGREKVLVVETTRAIPQGETLAMDYGPQKTEGQILLDHGCLDGLQAPGTFALTVTLPSDDRFFDDKIDILEQAGLQESNEFIVRSDSAPPEGMLAALRLVNIQGPDAFLLESIFRNEVWDHMQLPISQDNERAVCQSMVDGCDAVLSGYPSSQASLNATESNNKRESVAAVISLGEREALERIARYFQGRLDQLSNLEYYAERRLKRLGLLDKEGKPTDWDGFFEDGIA